MEDIKEAIGDDEQNNEQAAAAAAQKEEQDVIDFDKGKNEDAEEKKEPIASQEMAEEDENVVKTVKAGKSLLADGEAKQKKKVTW